MQSHNKSPVSRTLVLSQNLPQSENAPILEDTEALVRKITRLVNQATRLGVHNMDLRFANGTIIMSGFCRTFYTKQLAQEAALKVVGDVDLVNAIRVA